MNKKMFFILLLTTNTIYLFAQKNEKDKITAITWALKNDAMSGVGNHVSLPATTLLRFQPNGTWIASAPIAGNDSGYWHTNGKGKIIMELDGNNQAVVTKLEPCCLKMEQTNSFSKSTWIWERK